MIGSVGRPASPLWLLERAHARLPASIRRPIGTAYHRRTVDDDFDRYHHPPDPFAILSIDPARIESFTGRPYPPYHEKSTQLGTVRAGDWDRTDDPPIVDEAYRARYDLYRADRFSNSTFFESLRAHFDDGVDWTETEFVRRCLELVDDGEQAWRSLTSREDLLNRCDEIDALYDRIRDEGYRSQRELGVRSIMRVTDEVLVDIGRDGRFYFVNGRHRLAIAKLRGIDSIPVGVLVRHADWMAHRESCAKRSAVPDHPDLRDLDD